MENGRKSVIVVLGENGIFGESVRSIEEAPDHLGRVSRISKDVTRIVATHLEPDAEIWIFGCDAFKNGYEEAQQMESTLVAQTPELARRTKSFNGLLDTSHQSEAIRAALSAPGYENARVSVILPLEHKKRATKLMKAFGTNPNRVYEAHREYVLEKGISKVERERRKKEVGDIYFTFDMYLNLLKELVGDTIGLVDIRGKFSKKLSRRFRGQNASGDQLGQPSLQV